jgi:hypothetical protein
MGIIKGKDTVKGHKKRKNPPKADSKELSRISSQFRINRADILEDGD